MWMQCRIAAELEMRVLRFCMAKFLHVDAHFQPTNEWQRTGAADVWLSESMA
mgnify:CR=1 FL=1